MKLYTARTSPYARKVRVVLAEKKIECDFVDDRSMGTADNGSAIQSAGQDPRACPRRRNDALRFTRHRRIPRYREPGVATDTRTQPAAHRGAPLGSARRRHLRRGAYCRARNQATGGAAEQGMDRAPGSEDPPRRRRACQRAGRQAVVLRRRVYARRHRDRLRAGLSRPSPASDRLARRVPQPGQARGEAIAGGRRSRTQRPRLPEAAA